MRILRMTLLALTGAGAVAALSASVLASGQKPNAPAMAHDTSMAKKPPPSLEA